MNNNTHRNNSDNLQPLLNGLDLSFEESSKIEYEQNEHDLDDSEHIAILSTN